MPRSHSIPRGYEGPIFRHGCDIPCHYCDAEGVIEEGVQLDVDDFEACLCHNCGGTGIEPWRSAGGRDTSNPSRDALMNPRKGFWHATQLRRRSLQGRPLAALTAAEDRIREPADIPQITFDIQDYARRIFMPWATEQAA